MNRKLKALLWMGILAVLLASQVHAQSHALSWYFGNKAGIDFSGAYPLPLVDGQMEAYEGVAAISDSLGNLLMYTDGMTVWNGNHAIIATGLAGHESSSMAANIVQNPVNPDQYYLFTTRFTDNADGADNSGGHYYLFDFSAANPGGAMISDFSANPIQPNSTEKFLSIPFGPALVEEQGEDGYWIITHEFDVFTYNLSKLTAGLNFFDEANVGTQHSNHAPSDFGANKGAIGYLAASLRGDKIAVAIEGQKMFEVLGFNNNTGAMRRSSPSLPAGDPDDKKSKIHGSYGVAFSPSGRFLYGTSREEGILYQWDLENFNVVEEVYILRHNPDIRCGALQLGPDGKIYLSIEGQDYLGVINRPDRVGKRADYQEHAVRLLDNETGAGGRGALGLPQFDMSDFEIKHFGYSGNCAGDTTIFYMAGGTGGGYNMNSTQWTIMDPETGGMYGIVLPDDYIMGWYVFPQPGEYDIRVQSRYKGQNLDFVERITVYPKPKVKLAEDYTRMCRGDSLILDAGNGAFYEWADETHRERTYTVREEDFAVGLIQEYRVRVQDYTGCVGWDTVQVEIKSPPSVSFEYTKAICGDPTGSATVVPTSAVDDYYYEWEDFPGNTTNKIENVLGGDYVVYVTSKYLGCRASFVATVPELGGANVNIVPSVEDTICPGTSLTLSVSGATLFEWIEPAGVTGEQITVQPREATTYQVRAISRDELGNECITFADYTVHVHPEQKPEIGTDLDACEGDTIRISAPDGYDSYLWNNGMMGQDIELLEAISKLSLVVIDQNGCVFSDTLNVVFHQAPAVELGEDISLCTNEPVVLSGGEGDTYLWNTGATSPSLSVLQTGRYFLEITQFGCTNTDSVQVEIMNPDSLFIDSVKATDITCYGSNNGSIEIYAHGSGQQYLYSIDNGDNFIDNGGVFTGLPAGQDYQVVILEDSACSKSYETTFDITEPSEISADFRYVSPSCLTCMDGIIMLNNLTGGTPPYSVQWSTMDTGNKISGLSVGEYIVYITDSMNCTLTLPTALDLGFRIPTAFTPNGDGINDLWEIKVLTSYPLAVVQVYNKAGIRIFESPAGYPEPWDGTYNGSPVALGTYYFVVQLGPDQKPHTGNLTIIR